ncbi:hypothetical protein [Dongia sp.]|uniref:hypothetical protein n=1 Tax=Dongia sp. TaxID=1977262 RepID=UPI0035B21D02
MDKVAEEFLLNRTFDAGIASGPLFAGLIEVLMAEKVLSPSAVNCVFLFARGHIKKLPPEHRATSAALHEAAATDLRHRLAAAGHENVPVRCPESWWEDHPEDDLG